jgi:glycosyltransferase involved in cell wall biosynthesis
MRNIFETKDNYLRFDDIKSHLLYGDISMCKHPTISILIPAYNHPDYFREALQSAINQDCEFEYEIVVVDNNDLADDINSNQQIVMDSKASNVFYYRNEKNIGGIGNFNRCVTLARAPFVTFCHDDDMLLPTALSRLMDLQRKTKEKAILSATNTIDKDGKFISEYPLFKRKKKFGILSMKDCYPLDLFDYFISPVTNGGGGLFSKKCLMDIGGFDLDFVSPDYPLFTNYTYKFGSVFNIIPTHNYRIADNGSMTVYKQCLEMNKHLWKCISYKLSCPQWILNRIIVANYNITSIDAEVSWGNQDRSLYATIRLSDKCLMKFIRQLLLFKWFCFRI